MTARTPTRERPRLTQGPVKQQAPRTRWPAVAAGAVGMLIIAVIAAAVWFLVVQEPLDVGPAQQDDAAADAAHRNSPVLLTEIPQ